MSQAPWLTHYPTCIHKYPERGSSAGGRRRTTSSNIVGDRCVWSRARTEILDKALLIVYFLIHEGLLYYHIQQCGQPTDLLVVPHSKVDIVMCLVHTCPLGGHLVTHNIF